MRRPLVLATAAAITLTMAACSSSGSAAKTGSTGSTASSGSAESTAAGGGSSEVAAAKTAYTKYLTAPTTISVDTPLKSAPQKGKTFVFVGCSLSQCTSVLQGAEAAARSLGWTVKSIPFNLADPATLTSGLKRALQYNPVAVGFTGLPPALWSSVIPAYQKAGTYLIPTYGGPYPKTSVTSTEIGDTAFAQRAAGIIGNYFISDSNGKGHVLAVAFPDLPYFVDESNAFNSTVKSGCSGCKITTLSLSSSATADGSVSSSIVSALRRDSSINYVEVGDGAFIDNLPSLLAAAGMSSRVSVIGEEADAAIGGDITSGTVKAFTGIAAVYSGWAMIDAAARWTEKMPIPTAEGLVPVQLLTKDTIKTPADSYDYPPDLGAQFMKLWQVG